MTQAPSIKEALEAFAKAADNYADCTDDGKFIDDDATVTVGNLRDARAALATLQPSGEKREAIARALAEKWPGDFMQGDDEIEREPSAFAYEVADVAILALLRGGE